jgi:hypothetical protein
VNRRSTRYNQLFSVFQGFAAPVTDGELPHELPVTVVSTTIPATLKALQVAGELAHELGARISILVPVVVPYPLPLDRPPVDPKFTLRHFRTVCVDGSVKTRIDVRLCRDAVAAIEQALNPQSLVLIGGQQRLWPTREHRLAKRLTRAGHHVIFVSH